MAYTVFEENLQRKLRQMRREGVREGMEQGRKQGMEQGLAQGMEQGLKQVLTAMRDMLLNQVQLKFGESAARRVAGPLAGVEDLGDLQRAGRWIVASATADELVERLCNSRVG